MYIKEKDFDSDEGHKLRSSLYELMDNCKKMTFALAEQMIDNKATI